MTKHMGAGKDMMQRQAMILDLYKVSNSRSNPQETEDEYPAPASVSMEV